MPEQHSSNVIDFNSAAAQVSLSAAERAWLRSLTEQRRHASNGKFDLTTDHIVAVMGGRKISATECAVPGPEHSKRDKSLTITIDPSAPDGFVVHSFAGEDDIACKDYVRKQLGLPAWEPSKQRSDFNGSRGQDFTQAKKPADYVYQLADGTPYLKVHRYYKDGDKQFAQSHWNGVQWIKGAPQGPKIPYRLPELVKAERVFICEGEKDCDNLIKLRLFATTNAEGAGKWTSDLFQHFAGKTVFVLPDNDMVGSKHAFAVATQLTGIAREVRIVKLPNLAHKGDVSDWIEAGGTADELLELAQEAPIFDPTVEPEPEQAKPHSPLAMTFFDQCGDYVQKRNILKSLIARGETSAIIGPPKTTKSALADDIAIHAASGRDWRGHKSKEVCGVVIIAIERGEQHKRRMHAYAKRDGLHGLPIAVVNSVIDLLNPSCIDLIEQTVRGAEQNFGRSVGMVIIDTYSKGVAAGGGDEDKARDANRAAANLRALQGRIDVHVMLVGHTGKDESRGARGSNAHLADVDIMIQITGDDKTKSATVVAANDREEGDLATYELESVPLYTDEDGDPITAGIISGEQLAKPVKQEAKKGRPNASLDRAMEILLECLKDHGRKPSSYNDPEGVRPGFPDGIKVVGLDDWRQACERRALSSAETKKDRNKAFRRAFEGLRDQHRIDCLDGFVWRVIDFNV
jgi:hypothetical protein